MKIDWRTALTTGTAVLIALAAANPAVAHDPDNGSLAPMIKKVAPSVVNITVRGDRRRSANPFCNDPFWGRMLPECREFVGGGSGVIVDATNGYILTNAHVVAEATEIQVTLLDERRVDAEVIGMDEPSDLAVIKVEADKLTEAKLADSDKTEVGDYVVAIGNPFGLSNTVTSGIVSGLGRSSRNPEAYEDFIQTDASINPGNSGGALVNMTGEVVGINSMIFAPNGGGNIGIGFAIPSNMARVVMEQLIQYGEVRRGLLGVNIQDFTADLAEAYDADTARGALITEISPGSAADKAGLRAGDVIVAVNDKPVENALDLRNAIGLKREGDKIDVEYIRDGKTRSVSAVLGARSDARLARAEQLHPGLTGAEFQEVGESSPRYEGTEGILVVEVEPRSPAARWNLQENDVIVSVNRRRVRTLSEFREAVQGRETLILGIQRGESSVVLPIR